MDVGIRIASIILMCRLDFQIVPTKSDKMLQTACQQLKIYASTIVCLDTISPSWTPLNRAGLDWYRVGRVTKVLEPIAQIIQLQHVTELAITNFSWMPPPSTF